MSSLAKWPLIIGVGLVLGLLALILLPALATDAATSGEPEMLRAAVTGGIAFFGAFIAAANESGKSKLRELGQTTWAVIFATGAIAFLEKLL